jgi:hypothetical protein
MRHLNGLKLHPSERAAVSASPVVEEVASNVGFQSTLAGEAGDRFLQER